MGHNEPRPFCKSRTVFPGLLKNIVGCLDRDLEQSVAGCRPALEDIIWRYPGKGQFSKQGRKRFGFGIDSVENRCLIDNNNAGFLQCFRRLNRDISDLVWVVEVRHQIYPFLRGAVPGEDRKKFRIVDDTVWIVCEHFTPDPDDVHMRDLAEFTDHGFKMPGIKGQRIPSGKKNVGDFRMFSDVCNIFGYVFHGLAFAGHKKAFSKTEAAYPAADIG